jgi:hypothetical protein
VSGVNEVKKQAQRNAAAKQIHRVRWKHVASLLGLTLCFDRIREFLLG